MPITKLFALETQEFKTKEELEEALRQSVKFAKALIGCMKDGFYVIDKDSVCLDVNPSFCLITGFPREELIGSSPPYPFWPEEEYKSIEKVFQKTMRGDFGDHELIFKRKDSERFPVIVSPSWIRDEEGNIVCYFTTVKEVTELKKVEEEKRKIENEFIKRTKERLAALAPILQKVATGDFSVNVGIPKEEDEFSELLVGLHLMIEDLRGLKKQREGFEMGLERKVEESTEELQKKVAELERFTKVTMGRELRIIELKNKITELEKQLKGAPATEKPSVRPAAFKTKNASKAEENPRRFFVKGKK